MLNRLTDREATERQRRAWRRYLPVVAILCCGVVISVLLFSRIRASERAQAYAEFQRRADHLFGALQRGFDRNLGALYALRALYAASHTVERQEFWAFAQELLRATLKSRL